MTSGNAVPPKAADRNPYAPPLKPVAADAETHVPATALLAPKRFRLYGAIIDLVFVLFLAIPVSAVLPAFIG